jgi:hypothetical protein
MRALSNRICCRAHTGTWGRPIGATAFTLILFCCATARAQVDHSFHWHFSEFYSNADHTVQFIELECDAGLDSETLANGALFHSNSNGATTTLVGNLFESTLNKKLLLATPAFAALPGAVTPDFLLQEVPGGGFFLPSNDFVTLNHHGLLIDSQTILLSSPVPTDGVSSRHYVQAGTSTDPGTVALNSPTNFAGETGFVNVAGPQGMDGDFNDNTIVDAADYVVWRQNLFTLNEIPHDPTPGWVMEDDYAVWQQNFGKIAGMPGQGSSFGVAVPEPVGWMLVLVALTMVATMRQRRLTSASAFHPPFPPQLPRPARGNRCPSNLS